MSTSSLQPNHLSFTTTFLFVYLLMFIFSGTASNPFSPSSFCGPILHIQTPRAVDFILSLALLYMNTFIATPTSICGFYVGTQPPPAGYLEWNVCF